MREGASRCVGFVQRYPIVGPRRTSLPRSIMSASPSLAGWSPARPRAFSVPPCYQIVAPARNRERSGRQDVAGEPLEHPPRALAGHGELVLDDAEAREL